jgi:hypothetical protein
MTNNLTIDSCMALLERYDLKRVRYPFQQLLPQFAAGAGGNDAAFEFHQRQNRDERQPIKRREPSRDRVFDLAQRDGDARID